MQADLPTTQAGTDIVAELHPERAAAAYEKTFQICEIFWEWRHKVMVFTFTALSGLLALAAWKYDHNLRAAIAAPLLMAGLLSLASWVCDRRNEQILRNSRGLAQRIEAHWGFDSLPGPLGGTSSTEMTGWQELGTYHGVLRLAYLTLSFLFLIGGVLIAVLQPSPPS